MVDVYQKAGISMLAWYNTQFGLVQIVDLECTRALPHRILAKGNIVTILHSAKSKKRLNSHKAHQTLSF